MREGGLPEATPQGHEDEGMVSGVWGVWGGGEGGEGGGGGGEGGGACVLVLLPWVRLLVLGVVVACCLLFVLYALLEFVIGRLAWLGLLLL